MSNSWTTGNLITQADVIGWQNNPAALQEHSYKKWKMRGIKCALAVAHMAYTAVCLVRLCMLFNWG